MIDQNLIAPALGYDMCCLTVSRGCCGKDTMLTVALRYIATETSTAGCVSRGRYLCVQYLVVNEMVAFCSNARQNNQASR